MTDEDDPRQLNRLPEEPQESRMVKSLPTANVKPAGPGTESRRRSFTPRDHAIGTTKRRPSHHERQARRPGVVRSSRRSRVGERVPACHRRRCQEAFTSSHIFA